MEWSVGHEIRISFDILIAPHISISGMSSIYGLVISQTKLTFERNAVRYTIPVPSPLQTQNHDFYTK